MLYVVSFLKMLLEMLFLYHILKKVFNAPRAFKGLKI